MTSASRFTTFCLPATLANEGGYTCNSADAGNWTSGVVGKGALVGTNLGVSAPVWAEWTGHTPTNAIMRALTVDAVTPLYASKYWNPILGDQLPAGVDLSTFDMEVNTGSNGARCLQRAAGLTGSDVDGWIGPQTLAAVAAMNVTATAGRLSTTAARAMQTAIGVTADGLVGAQTLGALSSHPNAGALVLCAALYDLQSAYYRALSNPEFLTGWLNRCASRLTAALDLAMEN